MLSSCAHPRSNRGAGLLCAATVAAVELLPCWLVTVTAVLLQLAYATAVTIIAVDCFFVNWTLLPRYVLLAQIDLTQRANVLS